ncbi:hypothetical protein MKQ70_32550 [Chitinophaga sedimenti]|uniref:hypothetical protein n=1 Tax=Chitinophaga sedimenti TaxID=2033606 RepID=UPI0020030E88|nr:hypothetical protein [Chitinophaga sedimenti]MCK7559447.1 hypothetical protein [Chitinophaga sedimenti]
MYNFLKSKLSALVAIAAILAAVTASAAQSKTDIWYEVVSEDATDYYVGDDLTGLVEGEHYICIEASTKCKIRVPVYASNGKVSKTVVIEVTNAARYERTNP